MTDRDSTTDWRQLREFADVDLERSFVLSWHIESEALIVDIDLFLMPAHPFYEQPRPAEKVCIRPARIEFPVCEALGPDGGADAAIAESAGRLGHGAISSFRRRADGRYEIGGEFGTVFIDAERPLLKLRSL
ncbi:MAG: hypothetical protein WBN07_01220 [Woeseiaceae bacterium]